MIKIKIEKNKLNEPILKIGSKNLNEREEKLLKRALIEGKAITGRYNYEIPLRFFVPIMNIVSKDNIQLDKHSKLSYLEFSDSFDEKYFYTLEANAKYMKKWREENCPNIYKIAIDPETLEMTKEIAFKKITRAF